MDVNLLTIPETARALRLSVAAIRFWIASRRIPVVRLGRRVFIEEATVEQLIEAGRCPARDEVR
ncbi:MAG: helix-turn-helix domain-containing protein [Syntrophales bacterium]|nr:helix-turn-helix domain-containing protein [Syntrophales bacterium]